MSEQNGEGAGRPGQRRRPIGCWSVGCCVSMLIFASILVVGGAADVEFSESHSATRASHRLVLVSMGAQLASVEVTAEARAGTDLTDVTCQAHGLPVLTYPRVRLHDRRTGTVVAGNHVAIGPNERRPEYEWWLGILLGGAHGLHPVPWPGQGPAEPKPWGGP